MNFYADWTEKQDQELKDKEECGWDISCADCVNFDECNCNGGIDNNFANYIPGELPEP